MDRCIEDIINETCRELEEIRQIIEMENNKNKNKNKNNYSCSEYKEALINTSSESMDKEVIECIH
ncbi:hypothetical protein BI079_gp188 [Volepox virus]|uniref:Uncharacterized protein n=1 Tax=Volepox virus TaxID=28874 RepID=A0A1C9KCL9_9POXV|nr:hypothetical protein BI079_gp188 [Volepox virus]AOP31878.1 hypothetical protein VPXV-CA-188 [Volepox virus]